MDRVYYGERACSATKATKAPCSNKAYYLTSTGEYRCGVHSKAAQRDQLPANPHKGAVVAQAHDAHKRSYLTAQQSNQSDDRAALAICSKLAMRKEVPHVAGYLSVFPNKKHGGRADGLGLPALSPMNLGPVIHGQSHLPEAKNLENFWQSSKLFPSQELCALLEHSQCGDKCFRRYQAQMFASEEAERHNKHSLGDKKKVAPLGWVWTYADGSTKLFPYVKSRQFYCTFYERLARSTPEYAKLEALLAEGMNVNIIGYDGRTLSDKSMEDLYLDDSKPFGHELCLVAMLTLESDTLPWIEHRTELI